ncbi:MAG: PIN domain-containing protein, partial [Candidatus Nanohaloarchaea archaeon]|nr:PIN domain-containing protein [Candidatus Nanohaloarchaea archaeon]
MTEHVLDANVFIHYTGLNLGFEKAVTVPAVEEELESEEARKRYELSGVDIYRPGEEELERVREKAEELGEELSEADVQVLALARERGSPVVTDDYG